MYRIDDNLKDFLQSGVAIVVGSGDRGGRPQIAYAWAPRFLGDGAIELFLDAPRAEKTLVALDQNDNIAVTFADPATYRSVQLKGKFLAARPAVPDDVPWVRRGQEAFAASTALVGDPPATIANLFLDDFVSVSFTPEAAFDQTPGPDAGKPL